MATRILQIIRHLGHQTAQTLNSPNSWATIALWRRFFEYRDQQELEQEAAIEDVIDQVVTTETLRPIEFHRDSIYREIRSAHHDSIVKSRSIIPEQEYQRITRPDLSIPNINGDPMYLPQ
mmetsp:Transcript_7479/g.10880  ORF Transcript_7479/g.10880 Transcript_7479/m.10880 type:complete len:120 (+) Transcript_7479:124-483(+)